MDTTHYGIGSRVSITGTVATIGGDSHIVGTSTLFLTDYTAGDPIYLNGIWYTIFHVTNNTHAQLNELYPDTLSGLTGYKVLPTYLYQMDGNDPKGSFNPYSKPLPLGNGRVKGGGWKLVGWHWGFITQGFRHLLRIAVSGASTNDDFLILTRIYDDLDEFQWFSCVGIWPFDEDRQTTRRLNFDVKFQSAVQISAY